MTEVLPTIGPAWILAVDPPVFLAGMPYDDYVGIARPFAEQYGNVDAGFIIFPTWTIEREGIPEAIRARHDAHIARFPRHRLRFIGNTAKEAELLRAQGLNAEFVNHNFAVSDRIFRPLPETAIEFDAIYNSRFVPEKRHELAALVPRVAYLSYVEPEPQRLVDFHTAYRAAVARNPAHVLLNPMTDGKPFRMDHQHVNAALAQAAVGLVLSAAEGSSYCTVEYLLAGLPVVSTPSLGGRDVFFDPEYCIVCEPETGAVRDAVAELKARNIPREHIRARTLERLAPHRRRFLELTDELIAAGGGSRRYAGLDWPFQHQSSVKWAYYKSHLDLFAQLQRTALARQMGLDPRLLAKVQLTAPEIEPIVAAIRARPGCRLLVFGCGYDSAFWEAANAGGETAFVEDSPEWANAARPTLRSSAVHLVNYETRASDWRPLIDSPVRLKLALPPQVSGKTWDVVLVDGPAGSEPASAGRMKSIFAASRLVGRGGAVFVHDSEREVEAAFAARYLGENKVFVEARGRALLKGYAF